jgi:hypothetical protein
MLRFARVMVVLGVMAPLVSCNKAPQDDMQVQLNRIRAMVIESTLISVEAACADPVTRAHLVDGSLALLRRATAGKEMQRIHQMMGQMTMDKPDDVHENIVQRPESPEQAMHIAVHNAGGDGYDLLEAMTRPPGLSCAQVEPVILAAAAADLRQHHTADTAQGMTKILNAEVDKEAEKLDNEVMASITDNTPVAVRDMALALQKI